MPEYQKAPCLLAVVLGVTAAANAVEHEAGLLAATVMGVVLGNSGIASLDDLSRFKESVTVLLVSAVFVVLTAGLDPAMFGQLGGAAVLLLATVLFVVRPLSVFLSTLGTGISGKERLLLMWIAPRGVVAAAVAGVFGPRLVEAGHADGAALLPLVFAVVLITVVLHGLTLGPLARKLGLAGTGPGGLLLVGCSRWSTALAKTAKAAGLYVMLVDSSWQRLKRARLAGLKTHYVEVLSEEAEHVLPLHAIDLMLATTDNDAYNSLVSVRFGPELGRDRVWQLASPELESDHVLSLAVGHRGRIAIAEEADLPVLDERQSQGWRFSTTTFSKEHTFEEWRQGSGSMALPVLVLRAGSRHRFHGPRFPVEPRPGDTLISFGPPRADAG